MSSKAFFVVAAMVSLGSAPSLSHSQSLGDFLKLVPIGNKANNYVDAIKSLSEITQGQVQPGTEPENPEGKVLLYRTASCGYCKRAAAYMKKRNISFVERDIETNSDYKAEFARLRGMGVPLIVFREKTMSGFNEATFEQNYADFKHALENSSNSTGNASAVPKSAKIIPRFNLVTF